MLDRTIPFCNVIMRCDRILPMEITLPAGFRIRAYQPGDEAEWAYLHVETGDFCSEFDAEEYFRSAYGSDLSRVFFAVNPEGRIVGTCIAWQDDRRGERVSSIHWLAVTESEQRRGLGRALTQHALKIMRRENNAQSVYLHTQPWSWKAILLYVSLGFKLQPEDSFAAYENQYDAAMDALRPLLTPEQYAHLESNTASRAAACDLSAVRYDAKGLVPAVAQDAETGEVLMLAYMNEESLRETLASGYATYWSRSRNELWRKGATSGHLQKVLRMSYDCDGDAILMQVHQTGPACHTGKRSCFHNPLVEGDLPATAAILQTVFDTVRDRAEHPREGSYTNYLLAKGVEKIAKKVGEEASEAIIAAVKGDREELAGEAADLLYHLAVLLYQQGASMQDVFEVLKQRHT